MSHREIPSGVVLRPAGQRSNLVRVDANSTNGNYGSLVDEASILGSGQRFAGNPNARMVTVDTSVLNRTESYRMSSTSTTSGIPVAKVKNIF